jgi:predicted SprT family Zn-dependent metalloprotease
MLLREVIAEARALNIPVSSQIAPNVVINTRATARFGCCVKKGDRYIIELSDKLVNAPESSCRQTLAHEILHTCYGCRNHGPRWKQYAEKMNAAYGYHISRTGTHEALGIANTIPVKYVLVCQKCGAELKRTRMSNLVRYPERYRCKCGGTLKLL